MVDLLINANAHYLSCVRKGLLVWTGVGDPEISEGVEHGACGSRCIRRRDPWVI